MVANQSIADFSSVADFTVRGNGNALGTTGVQFQIFHVDHVDFTAAAIPVIVVSPTDGGGTDDVAAPVRAVLHAPAPNPFNPTTTLRYDLVRGGTVVLSVFDARGRKLADLVNAVQGAGPHSVTWNAQGLPSGAYFARLTTIEGTTARRATLLE
jgi:hypothetical protein